MLNLKVNIFVHVKDEALAGIVKEVADNHSIVDAVLSRTDDDIDTDALDYKNLGLLFTDDQKDGDINASEFLFTVYLSSSLPDTQVGMHAILDPNANPQIFRLQLKRVIDSAVEKYRLEITWSMLDTTINSVPDLIWYKAINGDHFNVNTPFCKVVTKTKEDIEGRKHAYIWDVSEDEAYACQESEETTLKAGKTCTFEELVNTPYGMRTMVTYKTPLRTARGTVIATAGVAQDVTTQREYEQQLHLLATTDPLSGLYNRRHLYHVGNREYAGQKTVIYIDIDYFKNINDNFGHEKGDAVICLVSRELQLKFPHDIVARMGGDEFVVLTNHELTDEEFERRLAKMQEAFDSSKEAEGIKVQLSIGLYRGDDDIDKAILLADELMYDDKRRHHEEAGGEG